MTGEAVRRSTNASSPISCTLRPNNHGTWDGYSSDRLGWRITYSAFYRWDNFEMAVSVSERAVPWCASVLGLGLCLFRLVHADCFPNLLEEDVLSQSASMHSVGLHEIRTPRRLFSYLAFSLSGISWNLIAWLYPHSGNISINVYIFISFSPNRK